MRATGAQQASATSQKKAPNSSKENTRRMGNGRVRGKEGLFLDREQLNWRKEELRDTRKNWTRTQQSQQSRRQRLRFGQGLSSTLKIDGRYTKAKENTGRGTSTPRKLTSSILFSLVLPLSKWERVVFLWWLRYRFSFRQATGPCEDIEEGERL